MVMSAKASERSDRIQMTIGRVKPGRRIAEENEGDQEAVLQRCAGRAASVLSHPR